MAKPKGKPNLPGRPFKEIDLILLRKLAAMQCTYPEMSACLQCHPETLSNNYSEIIKEEAENGKSSLRRLQFKHAQKTPSMAMFLGKVYLNQKEGDDNKARVIYIKEKDDSNS